LFENQKGFFRRLFLSACKREKMQGYAPKEVENFFSWVPFFSFEKMENVSEYNPLSASAC